MGIHDFKIPTYIYIYIDIMHVHQFMTSVSYCIFSKPISTHRKDRQRERD